MNTAISSTANFAPLGLAAFVDDLLSSGSVTVAAVLVDFSENDLAIASKLLEAHHASDQWNMPLTAPDFHPAAAVWAARYLYRCLQFLLVRNLEAEAMSTFLADYTGGNTAEEVYSADLTLRNLPQVHGLARSLSPTDPLVLRIQATANRWPFSVVGMQLEIQPRLPEHPSLRLAYADRVIAARDRKLSAVPDINEGIRAALGSHVQHFWPTFDPITP